MKMELIEGYETSAIGILTPGNYSKENILHTEHGESLKSRVQLIVVEKIKRTFCVQYLFFFSKIALFVM